MCTFTGGAIFESVVVKLLDIPNTALDTLEVDDVAILRARGIIFNDDSDTVTVFASEENNLTEVHCKEMQFPSNLLSETLVVTVIGMYLFNNSETSLIMLATKLVLMLHASL